MTQCCPNVCDTKDSLDVHLLPPFSRMFPINEKLLPLIEMMTRNEGSEKNLCIPHTKCSVLDFSEREKLQRAIGAVPYFVKGKNKSNNFLPVLSSAP